MMTAALFLAVVGLAVWAWYQIGDLSTRNAARADTLRELADRLADAERRVDDLTERAVQRGLDLDATASTVIAHGQSLTDLRAAVDDDRRAADQRHRATTERVAKALATAQVADTAITAMEAALRSKRPKKRGAK